MKNKIKILVALTLVAISGLTGKSYADIFTTVSTGVFISSGFALGDMKNRHQIMLDFIAVSTGDGAANVLFIDSAPLQTSIARQGASEVDVNKSTMTGVTPASFPPSQWILPYIVTSSATIASTGSQDGPDGGIYFKDFRNAYGEGLPIKNGIVIIKNNTGNASPIVTVGYSYRKEKSQR